MPYETASNNLSPLVWGGCSEKYFLNCFTWEKTSDMESNQLLKRYTDLDLLQIILLSSYWK
jgi:hypothetical protein